MNLGFINLQDKRTEQSVISISTKIADAVDMMQRAKEIIINLENALIKAQLASEELYVGLNTQSGACDDTRVD